MGDLLDFLAAKAKRDALTNAEREWLECYLEEIEEKRRMIGAH